MSDGTIETKKQEGEEGVFVGTYVHALDPKRRLTIPSAWRDRVEGRPSFYVLPDVDERCLCVFSGREMQRRLESVGHHSIVDRKARQFARVLASRSDLVDWDSQGRIRIKDELLEHAGIKGTATLVGNFRFFEVWDPENLKKSGVLDDTNVVDAVRHVGF
ncbi:MAG: hypothetical protein WCL44_02455 [bacterium]